MKYPTLDSVINDKELEPFGQFLIPSPMGFTKAARKLTLDQLSLVMPWHNNYHVEDSLDVIHELKERKKQGQPVFFDIYSEEEKRLNRRLKETGLFYFAGRREMPFAIICAGGGFVYVASLHESLPAALHLSRRGIHAFAIQYRTSSAREACEDLARAIGFIFRHAGELGIDTRGYSLWGGSAGARMAAYLGGLGTEVFGEKKYPRPGAVIMQYTGLTECTPLDPPTFACVGDRDLIASPDIMKWRIRQLEAHQVPAEFHLYHGVEHGFGLGRGTPASGWIDRAAAFWNKYGLNK